MKKIKKYGSKVVVETREKPQFCLYVKLTEDENAAAFAWYIDPKTKKIIK